MFPKYFNFINYFDSLPQIIKNMFMNNNKYFKKKLINYFFYVQININMLLMNIIVFYIKQKIL